jgi:hypothetical protein
MVGDEMDRPGDDRRLAPARPVLYNVVRTGISLLGSTRRTPHPHDRLVAIDIASATSRTNARSRNCNSDGQLYRALMSGQIKYRHDIMPTLVKGLSLRRYSV